MKSAFVAALTAIAIALSSSLSAADGKTEKEPPNPFEKTNKDIAALQAKLEKSKDDKEKTALEAKMKELSAKKSKDLEKLRAPIEKKVDDLKKKLEKAKDDKEKEKINTALDAAEKQLDLLSSQFDAAPAADGKDAAKDASKDAKDASKDKEKDKTAKK